VVTIITEYNEGDTQLFEHYWCPLLYKYKDQKVEFIFVDSTSNLNKIAPKLPNVKIKTISKENFISAAFKVSSKAKYDTIVFTKIDLVPTYAAMVAFKQAKKSIINILESGKIISHLSESPKLIMFDNNITMYSVENE